jgi:four helix bundle protein
VRDHRNLRAWQEARQVTRLVLQASRRHWKPWASALFFQLQRASLSVSLNIAEGYTFGRSPSYARHLAIAYGSAVETVELLEIAAIEEVLPPDAAQALLQHAYASQALLLGLLKHHRPLS